MDKINDLEELKELPTLPGGETNIDSYKYFIDTVHLKLYNKERGEINIYYPNYSIKSISNILIKLYYINFVHKLLQEIIKKQYFFIYENSKIINDIKKINTSRFYKSYLYI